MSLVKNVVFDFGNVLLGWNPENLYNKVFDDKDKMKWFLNNVCSLDWNLRMDKGELFKDTIKELVCSFPEYKEQIEIYHSRWDEMITGVIDGSVEILKELKKHKIPGYGLSNWSYETFVPTAEKHTFFNLLDGKVISGQVKEVKPEPAIYNILLKNYSLKAEECVFIDDSKANIETAKKIGFQTIHFESPEKTRKALKELGFCFL